MLYAPIEGKYYLHPYRCIGVWWWLVAGRSRSDCHVVKHRTRATRRDALAVSMKHVKGTVSGAVSGTVNNPTPPREPSNNVSRVLGTFLLSSSVLGTAPSRSSWSALLSRRCEASLDSFMYSFLIMFSLRSEHNNNNNHNQIKAKQSKATTAG